VPGGGGPAVGDPDGDVEDAQQARGGGRGRAEGLDIGAGGRVLEQAAQDV
jgi:hypothetical protein